MMTRAEKLRRLFIGVCLLGIGLGAVYLWLSAEAGKPYQTKNVGDISLRVPRLYLPDGQQDLNELVKEYIVSVAGRIQLSAYADEILLDTPLDQNNRGSEIIWTIEPAGYTPHTDGVLQSDIALFTGQPPYENRQANTEAQSGLFLYRTAGENDRTYSTSRLRASETFAVDPGFAHCVDFRTVSLYGPLGRCSTHFVVDDLLIIAHFNRELAWHTQAIRRQLRQLAEDWQKPEQSG